MTILIKGMKMPTDPFYPIHATIYADGTVITGHGIGEFAKEAVSVPTPHGRLVDAGVFEKANAYFWNKDFINPKYPDTLADLVNAAPTVIEAEE